MKKGGALLVLAIFLCSFTLASIEITQPFEIYNFGDFIFTTVTVNPASVSGSFEIKVVCNNASATVYKIAPADGSFFANQEQKVNHKIVLTKEFIGELSGNCNLVASLGTESVTSNSFLLTSEIDVKPTFDKSAYNPEEKILLNLESKKANGKSLNGFVEISGITSSKTEIKDGKVNITLNVANNTAAGRYDLTILVYDRDGFGILNQKTVFAQIEIRQVARKIILNLPGFEINPGNTFDFSADLFDQTEQKMSGTLAATMTSPTGERMTTSFQAGTMAHFDILTNATAGKYKLVVSQGNLKEEKEINVNAVPKISISFVESLVVLTNIGNAPFSGTVDFLIGTQTESVETELAAGQEKKYNLKAPTGTYDISVETSDGTKSQTRTLLTGRAISVSDWKGINVLEKYPVIWFVLGGIILLIGLIFFFRFKQKTSVYGEKIKEDKIEDISVLSATTYSKKQYYDVSAPQADSAQSSLNMKGSKDFCSVLSLNIKNHSTLSKNAISNLNEIINKNKGTSGVVDWRGNHALIIFSPLVSKTFKNEIIAVQAGEKIKRDLEDYNKKFSDKISFGVGIHCGEMVSALNSGKLNYTSLGNSILLAKKISDLSDSKLLVSTAFRQKLMRELRVNKLENVIGDTNVFEVLKVANVEANEEKLKQLLKRTGFS